MVGFLFAVAMLGACDDEPAESEPAGSEPAEQPVSEGEPDTETEAVAEPDPCVASALAATKQLKMGLKTRLMEAMGEGPAAAVRVCHDEAAAIRTRVAEESGVRLGRTSTKLRNPANAEAPEWAKAYLEEPTREDGGYANWVERTEGEAHVVSPLIAQGVCLTCHGESIPPAIDEVLAEHYPEDEARGFAAGDLRGVVWASATCER